MRHFKYGTCNKNILPHNGMIRKRDSTRLNGWLFGDKVETVAEAAAELALTAKEQLLVANGMLKNVTVAATGEMLLVSGNGTQLLGNLSAIATQFNLVGQGFAFSFAIYTTGVSVTDFCLCPSVTGKVLYGAAAICSSASVVTTGCSMSVGTVAPYSSYMLGMGGAAFRGISRYMRIAARAQNPVALESIF